MSIRHSLQSTSSLQLLCWPQRSGRDPTPKAFVRKDYELDMPVRTVRPKCANSGSSPPMTRAMPGSPDR
ncbi:hypothetical protein ACHAWF_016823 [Thalassiosira exigua]